MRTQHSPCYWKFQSSPGREAGRYDTTLSKEQREDLFQSSPGREAGRYARR